MKKNFYITTKVLLGLGSMLFFLFSIDFLALYQMQRFGKNLRFIRNSYLPIMKFSSLLEAWHYNLRSELALFERNPIFRPQKWRALLERLSFPKVLSEKMLQIERKFEGSWIGSSDLSGIIGEFRRIKKGIERYQKVIEKSIHKPFLLRKKAILSAISELHKEIESFSMRVEFLYSQRILQLEREENYSVGYLIIFSGMGIIIAVIALFFIWRSLARFKLLVEITKQIARGNYRFKVEIPSGDEVGLVAEALSKMASSLEERERRLAQKQGELEKAYLELKLSYQRLMRLERLAAIGRLAAQITHEIRNPLNAIGLNLELIEEDLLRSRLRGETLELVRSTLAEVERLSLITEEYLKFARLPPPRFERTDLNDLILGIVKFLEGELRAEGIGYELNLSSGLPFLSIDRNQFRQALLNLLRNAIEAARETDREVPKIAIATRRVEGGVLLEIFDNGPGISEDDLEYIFDPFFSTKRGGSGLGLPLTRQIIHGHGAKISCRLFSEGEWSVVFSILFSEEFTEI